MWNLKNKTIKNKQKQKNKQNQKNPLLMDTKKLVADWEVAKIGQGG